MSFSHGGGGGVTHPVLDGGGTFSSHDGGYPIQSWWGYQSTHRRGEYHLRYGLGGVPHPRSRLSTLARGYLPWPGDYLPWLGGTYLGQEDTSSNVGTYSQRIYPLPRVHTPPSPSTLTRGVPILERGGMSLNEGTTASVGNP